MSRIRALLVDLDGTLANTSAANFAAYSSALAEVGVYITLAQFEDIVGGRNWKQFLPGLLESAGVVAQPAVIAKRKAELYATMMDRIVLNEALIKLIELSRPTCRTALVTNASATNVQSILNHHRLGYLFDVVVTGDDVSRHKPDPEAYYIAAERLRVCSNECLVIEDSAAGIASAMAFGAAVLKVDMISPA